MNYDLKTFKKIIIDGLVEKGTNLTEAQKTADNFFDLLYETLPDGKEMTFLVRGECFIFLRQDEDILISSPDFALA